MRSSRCCARTPTSTGWRGRATRWWSVAPWRWSRLARVDGTPGGDSQRAEPIIAFIPGPEVFATFDETLERTIRFNPGRSEASLRRGILHTAKELAEGSWSWRWDPNRPE